ncbi:hypothetical protein NP493_194g01009 [Ridgeia piscesae]|uniref:Uncharacterized protein n=1 Tax=Ridgeia piscesae TaxID=27915 RepID=A0AAD9UER3_RIDPI|nr:hypothetical protein NP493_194g01009 [Ridgeia piscesae]
MAHPSRVHQGSSHELNEVNYEWLQEAQRGRSKPVYQVIPAYEQFVQRPTNRPQPVYQVIPGYEQLPQRPATIPQPVYQVIPGYEQLDQRPHTDIQPSVYDVIPGSEQDIQTSRSQHHVHNQHNPRSAAKHEVRPHGQSSVQQQSTIRPSASAVPSSLPDTPNTQKQRQSRPRVWRYCCICVAVTVFAGIIAAVIGIAVVLSGKK